MQRLSNTGNPNTCADLIAPLNNSSARSESVGARLAAIKASTRRSSGSSQRLPSGISVIALSHVDAASARLPRRFAATL